MNSRKSNRNWWSPTDEQLNHLSDWIIEWADLADMALKALVVCAALYFVIEIGAGLALHFGWLR